MCWSFIHLYLLIIFGCPSFAAAHLSFSSLSFSISS